MSFKNLVAHESWPMTHGAKLIKNIFRSWDSLENNESIEMNLSVRSSENIDIYYFSFRKRHIIPVPKVVIGIHYIAHNSTSTKIEISLTDVRNSSVSGQVTGDRSKNDIKSRLKMKIVQSVEKSFMYQALEQSINNQNFSDSIQKIAINETTPIFLQAMVSEQTSSTNFIVLEIFWKPSKFTKKVNDAPNPISNGIEIFYEFAGISSSYRLHNVTYYLLRNTDVIFKTILED